MGQQMCQKQYYFVEFWPRQGLVIGCACNMHKAALHWLMKKRNLAMIDPEKNTHAKTGIQTRQAHVADVHATCMTLHCTGQRRRTKNHHD